MEQISIETALATQTLPFTRSQGRGQGIQCKVIKKNGERCQRYAIRGGFVCHGPHGGSLPVVRQAALTRKLRLANHAYQTLLALMDSEDDKVRLKATKYALKFADLSPAEVRRRKPGNPGKGRQPEVGAAPDHTPLDLQIEAALGQLKELEA